MNFLFLITLPTRVYKYSLQKQFKMTTQADRDAYMARILAKVAASKSASTPAPAATPAATPAPAPTPAEVKTCAVPPPCDGEHCMIHGLFASLYPTNPGEARAMFAGMSPACQTACIKIAESEDLKIATAASVASTPALKTGKPTKLKANSVTFKPNVASTSDSESESDSDSDSGAALDSSDDITAITTPVTSTPIVAPAAPVVKRTPAAAAVVRLAAERQKAADEKKQALEQLEAQHKADIKTVTDSMTMVLDMQTQKIAALETEVSAAKVGHVANAVVAKELDTAKLRVADLEAEITPLKGKIATISTELASTKDAKNDAEEALKIAEQEKKDALLIAEQEKKDATDAKALVAAALVKQGDAMKAKDLAELEVTNLKLQLAAAQQEAKDAKDALAVAITPPTPTPIASIVVDPIVEQLVKEATAIMDAFPGKVAKISPTIIFCW